MVEEEFNLEPQIYIGSGSSTITNSLFLTLTGYDTEKAQVVPEVAQSWTVSPDGRIYTFKLRGDIPWVTHNLDGETKQVTDEDGDPRYVSAGDFVYAFKRLCDPNLEGYVNRPKNIQGCQAVLDYEDPGDIPAELFEEIGVEAVSETELIITLEEPSGFFLTQTSSLIASAVPEWAIGKYGEAWTNPGLITSNGPYVIDQWKAGENITLLRNELLPDDLHGEGNILKIDIRIVEDQKDAYNLWKSNEVDYASVPDDVLASHLDQYSDLTYYKDVPVVIFNIFQHDRPPFNDIHLRRAFSASFDRTSFINDVLVGDGIPLNHFAPPGVFGAPTLGEVGVGYDPEYAQSELEKAGYPGCEGLPPITFISVHTDITAQAEELLRFWEQGLGCPKGSLAYNPEISYGLLAILCG
jgi:oligopeptide transport system substrate-binding protein